jgi:hypothetical protein
MADIDAIGEHYLKSSDIVINRESIRLGSDVFDVQNIFGAILNRDPEEGNGVAGGISIRARFLGGPEGMTVSKCSYAISDDARPKIEQLAETFKAHSVSLREINVHHDVFSMRFLGGPDPLALVG